MAATEYFLPGEIAAYFRIVERMSGGPKMRATYRVHSMCCGTEREITHRAIDYAVRDGAVRCQACRIKRMQGHSGGIPPKYDAEPPERTYHPGWGFALDWSR